MATTNIHPYRVRRSALRIAAIYAALAFTWISLSDVLIELFVRDVDTLTQIQMAKGGLFVAVTSVVLWLLIKHDMRRLVNSGFVMQTTLPLRYPAIRLMSFVRFKLTISLR
jgi:hypothetical protein